MEIEVFMDSNVTKLLNNNIMNYLRHSLDKLCLSSHNFVLAFCKKLVVYDFSSAIIHCSQW